MSDSTYDFDLVCIGSGPAGQQAAIQAAKIGKRAAVIERHRVVGGVCLETGTIPSKSFRQAVIEAVRPCGTALDGNFESAVHVTAEQLIDRIQHVVRAEAEVVEEHLRRNDVDLFHGTATFAGPHELRIEGREKTRVVTAETVIIASGTRPAKPEGVPTGDVVMTSDDILKIKKIPRTLAVVGGGVIGIEYASIFAKLGVEVTLIERHERPLPFLDHEITDELIHQMRSAYVTFRLEEAVSGVEFADVPHRHAVINLESGKRIVADLVLYSIGRVGAVDALNLDAAGLKSDGRGRLKVNDRFQTDVPHVYAVGDVIGFPSLAATSSEQGRLAACYALGVDAPPMAQHFPIGIYSIPEASMVGQTEQELTKQKVPYETGVARYREIARGQILGDDSGLFKMLFHRETRKLLGVHTIGTGATELVHIGQAVIGLGGGLDYFLNTVFNYPTLAECYKVAALDAADKLA